MDDLQTFNRFLEPTRAHVQKVLDGLSQALVIGDPDFVDERLAFVLRDACLCLERTLDMLNRAERLLKQQQGGMQQ
jgi:hypothetical protein